jgi:DNA-binding transcriptional MerR regulator
VEKYLTAKQVAQALQVSERTVRRWGVTGQLKPKKIGGVKRYKVSDLEK